MDNVTICVGEELWLFMKEIKYEALSRDAVH